MIEANQKGEYSVFAFKRVFSDGEQSFDNRDISKHGYIDTQIL